MGDQSWVAAKHRAAGYAHGYDTNNDASMPLPEAALLPEPAAPPAAPPPLTQVYWKNNVNGVWSNVNNWSGGALPGPTNQVLLDTLLARTVTYASGVGTIYSINAVTDTLNMTGGTLTVSNTAAFSAGLTVGNAELNLGGNTNVAGGFNDQQGYLVLATGATLAVAGAATLGTYNNTGNTEIDGGALTTSGTTTIADYYGYYVEALFGGGIVWTNTGTVDDAGLVWGGDGGGTTASFINAAGASYIFTSDDASIDNGNAYGQAGIGSSTFSNAGTLGKIGGAGGTSNIYSVFTNTGVINVTTGTIEFDGGGSFGGTLTGGGQIAFGGGNATLTAGSNLTVANWLIDGAAVSNATSLRYTGTLTLSSGSLTLDGTTDSITGLYQQTGNNSTLYLNDSSLSLTGAYLGYGYLEGPGTLTLGGASSLAVTYYSYYYIGDGATLVNTGTLTQNGEVEGSGGGFAIVNNVGATYDVAANSYLDDEYADSTFTNAGTYTSAAPNYDYVYSDFNNTGVINAQSGALYFENGGVFGGTLTGAGAIVFGNGQSTLTANAIYSSANLQLSGGSLTLNANATPAAGSFQQTGGYLYLNGNTLSVNSASLAGGYLEGGGTVLTTGATSIAYNNTYFIGNNVNWLNSGTITQSGSLYIDSGDPTSFNLVNTTTGTYDITGGDYLGYNYSQTAPTLENAGTLEETGSTSTGYVYAFVTNTGVITTTGGAIDFENGGNFGGTLTGTGSLNFSGGNSTLTTGSTFTAAQLEINGGYLEISAGASLNASSLYLYYGSMQIDQNITLGTGVFGDYNGDLYLNGNTLTAGGASLGGYIIGAGALITNGATALNSTNLYLGNTVTWTNTGTVTQTASVYDYTSYGGGYTINNLAGAVYDVNAAAIGYNDNSSNYGTFNNAGTFAEIGASSVYVYGDFASTGTVSVSGAGQIQFNNQYEGTDGFAGSITGTGTVIFYNGNYNLGLTTAAKTNLAFESASVYLTGNTAIAGPVTAYYASFELNGFNLSLSGTNTFNSQGYQGVYVDGPGTLTTTGSTSIGGYYNYYTSFDIGGGGTWNTSGIVTEAGVTQIGDSSGAGILSIAAGGAFDLNSDYANVNQGTYVNAYGQTLSSGSTIINAGTFGKTGGTLTTSIYATLLSTGIITATTGTLALDNGGSLAGTIADKSNVALGAGAFSEGILTIGGGATVASAATFDATGTLTLGDSTNSTKAATFANSGTYEIDGNGGIISGSTAANLFTNTGLLEKITGTGRSVVSITATNTGTIESLTGTLALTGTLTGKGTLDIGAGAALELGAAVASTQTVSYTANTGTLILDTVTGTHGSIANFIVGDVIDLVNTSATSATLNSSGGLVLYNGSTVLTTLSLTGTHTGDTYSFLSDGHGGTLLGIATNATSWKGTNGDWFGTNTWTAGAPGTQTNATVSATGKYTLSLAAGETAYTSTLLLDGTSATYSISGALNIGRSISLQAGTLAVAGSISGGTLALAGGTMSFTGGTLANLIYEGALNLTAASQSIYLQNTTLKGASGSGGGTINVSGSGATVYIDGVTTLTQATIDLGSSGTQAVLASNDADGQGGVLTLGTLVTITQTGLNAGLADSGGAYDAVLNDGTITATTAKGDFTISGSDFENDGTIVLGNGDTMNIASAAFVNAGSFTATGATLSLGGLFYNAGSFITTNTLLNLSGAFTTGQLNALLGSGDTVSVGGSLTNIGATLTIGTGETIGQMGLTGTIEGGTIYDAGNGLVTNESTYGTLSDVTYEGTLNVTGGLYIAGTFTASGTSGTGNGAILDTGSNTEIVFENTRTLSNESISLGNASADSYLSDFDNTGSGSTLTIGASTTITQAGALASLYYYQSDDQIINQGNILADSSGGTFLALQGASGSFTNQGSIIVSAGDIFGLNGPGTFTNLSGTTLTGGMIEVEASSTLELANNTTLTTLAATLTLSGTNSVVEALNTSTNKQVTLDSKLISIAAAGDLTLLSGRNFTAVANSGNFTDAGTLALAGTGFTATTLTIAGGTLGGYGTVAGAVADGGTIAAAGGTLTFSGAVTGTGSLTAAAGATIDLTQGVALGEAVAGAGTLRLDGAAPYTLAAASTLGIGTVQVDSGATLSGAGGISGNVTDAGTVAASTGTLLINGAVAGSGTLTAAAGDVLDLAGGGSFAGSIGGAGTLKLDGTNPFTLQAGAYLGVASVLVDSTASLDLTQGGSLPANVTGAGTLQLDGTTPYTLAGGTLTIGTVRIDAGVGLSGAGTLAAAITDAGNLGAASGTLAVAGAVAGTGTLYAAGGAVLDLRGGGALTQQITGAGTLLLDGATGFTLAGATIGIGTVGVDAGATLSGTGTLTGSVVDAGTLAAQGGELQITGALSGSGALVANAGALIDLTAGGLLAETVSGAGTLQLDSAGYTLAGAADSVATLLVDAGASLTGSGGISSNLIDGGTITASGGTLTLSGAVSGAGALTAASGAVLDLVNGDALSEAITGAGTLQLDSGTYTLAGTSLATAAVLVDAAATLTGSGTLTGALTDTGSVIATGSLVLGGPLSGSGTLSAAAGAVLDLTDGGAITGISGAGKLQLDGTTGFTIAGVTSIAALSVDAGANLSGFGSVAGSVTDSGAITASGGTLVLGALTGSGALSAASGAVLDLTGGGSVTGIGGAGRLQLDGATGYTMAGATSIAALSIDAGAALSGIGTLSGAVADAGSLTATGGTLLVSGALTGTGALSATAGALLDLSAGGTLTQTIGGAGTLQLDGTPPYTLAGGAISIATLNVDAGVTLTGNGTVASTISNAGTIAASGGKLVLGGALSGAGTLQAAAGTVLDLTAGGSLSQTLSGAGTLELGGAYTLGAKVPSIANLAIDAGASLSGAGTYTGIVADNGSLIANGGTLILSGAVSATGTLAANAGALLDITANDALAAVLSGAGTVQLAGAITLNAGASLAATTILDTGNITLGAGENLSTLATTTLDMTAAAKATLTLAGATGDTLTTAGTVLATGAANSTIDIGIAAINSGNISVTGGATMAFLGSATNTGIIDASAGTVSFASIVSGTGTLEMGATGTLALSAGSAAGQTIDFLSSSGALLDLTKPTSFLGTIAGFGGSDKIDLLKTAETGFSYNNGTLTVVNGSATVASLHFTGSYTTASFALTSDGHNGTFITFV